MLATKILLPFAMVGAAFVALVVTLVVEDAVKEARRRDRNGGGR